MLQVSNRFLAAVRDTHAVSVAAAVYAPTDLITPVPVQIISGEVRVDRDARIRRQGTLNIAFTLEDPTIRDLVRELPFGGYATVERGIQYADGDVERIQLGRFRVDSIVWGELQGMASLTLSDRMAQVVDEQLTAPYAPAGMKPTDAVVDLIDQVFGDTIAYHVLTDPSSENALGDTIYSDDRAGAVNDLASSINAEALFDNLGDFVIRPVDPNPAPAWTVDAGSTGSMITASETLDRSSVRNGVAVTGQPDAEAPPFYALATYDDPDAPTRWGGPFGKVPLLSQSTSVATQDQADATARSLLNLRLGLQRTLTIDALPNPALEPDDVIELVFADGRTEQQVVNSTRIDIGATDALSLTTSSTVATLPRLEPAADARLYVTA